MAEQKKPAAVPRGSYREGSMSRGRKGQSGTTRNAPYAESATLTAKVVQTNFQGVGGRAKDVVWVSSCDRCRKHDHAASVDTSVTAGLPPPPGGQNRAEHIPAQHFCTPIRHIHPASPVVASVAALPGASEYMLYIRCINLAYTIGISLCLIYDSRLGHWCGHSDLSVAVSQCSSKRLALGAIHEAQKRKTVQNHCS